jgi:hypothetical protein
MPALCKFWMSMLVGACGSGLPRRLCLLAMTRVFRPCGTEFKNAIIARPAGPWQSSCAAGCTGNLWIAASALSPRNDEGVFRPCGTEFKNAVIARPLGPWQSSCAAGCNGNLWIAASALSPRNDDAGVLSNKLTNNLD